MIALTKMWDQFELKNSSYISLSTKSSHVITAFQCIFEVITLVSSNNVKTWCSTINASKNGVLLWSFNGICSQYFQTTGIYEITVCIFQACIWDAAIGQLAVVVFSAARMGSSFFSLCCWPALFQCKFCAAALSGPSCVLRHLWIEYIEKT